MNIFVDSLKCHIFCWKLLAGVTLPGLKHTVTSLNFTSAQHIPSKVPSDGQATLYAALDIQEWGVLLS
jgi:hypothetical protein